jgi:trimeric autotransporter adhesin
LVEISATYNGTRQTAVLTVMPRISSTLSLNPACVIGGIHSIGTLLLNEPAPRGGALVSLRSSDTASATVPPSVIVAAKATTATFTIRTNPVANEVVVATSASGNVLDVEARLVVQSVPSHLVRSEEKLRGKFRKDFWKLLVEELPKKLKRLVKPDL